LRHAARAFAASTASTTGRAGEAAGPRQHPQRRSVWTAHACLVLAGIRRRRTSQSLLAPKPDSNGAAHTGPQADQPDGGQLIAPIAPRARRNPHAPRLCGVAAINASPTHSSRPGGPIVLRATAAPPATTGSGEEALAIRIANNPPMFPPGFSAGGSPGAPPQQLRAWGGKYRHAVAVSMPKLPRFLQPPPFGQAPAARRAEPRRSPALFKVKVQCELAWR